MHISEGKKSVNFGRINKHHFPSLKLLNLKKWHFDNYVINQFDRKLFF